MRGKEGERVAKRRLGCGGCNILLMELKIYVSHCQPHNVCVSQCACVWVCERVRGRVWDSWMSCMHKCNRWEECRVWWGEVEKNILHTFVHASWKLKALTLAKTKTRTTTSRRTVRDARRETETARQTTMKTNVTNETNKTNAPCQPSKWTCLSAHTHKQTTTESQTQWDRKVHRHSWQCGGCTVERVPTMWRVSRSTLTTLI